MVSRESIVNALLYCFLIFVLFSGYLFIDYSDNRLNQNFTIRAMVLIGVFLYLVVSLAIVNARLDKLPIELYIFLAFFVYVVGVSIVSNAFLEYISPVIRYLIYFLAFLLAYQAGRSYSLLRSTVLLVSILMLIQCLLDIILERGLNINNAWRIGGSVGSAIGFSAILYIILIFSFYFLIREKTFQWMILTPLLFLGILLTATRSVTFASLVSLPVIYIMSRRNIQSKVFSLLVGSILFFLSIYLILQFSEIGSRVDVDSLDGDSSTLYRLYIFNTYFSNVSLFDLFFGLGLGGFPGWFEVVTGESGIAPHSELLWLISEGGVIGVILLSVAYFSFVVRFFLESKAVKIDRELAYTTLFLVFSPQLAFQLANPLYFYQVNIVTAVLLGLVYREYRYLKFRQG
ncbi:O-antigen ligase family protein [Saccharospirillum salsuginis]|uniref:O-antigen ligase family protein n=1 Tax=Saccharospirillum salsuginis TaxID=418750 RepID=UPI00167556A5|nr:O-antigen ligase family protein [Saccharospirillum salsuginis]